MMNKLALCLPLIFAFAVVAYAEDEEAPAPQRGFKDGKFVDDYFGIVFEAPGLEEGFVPGSGGVRALWSGKAEGGATVELICQEVDTPEKATNWLAMQQAKWEKDGKTRTDLEEGTDPQPWVMFVQESLAGFQRHHGYAVYPRGHQAFVVHARVSEKSDTSADAIKKVLFGLKVDPEKKDCFYLAHLYASRNNGDPNDPRILLAAAMGNPGYVTADTPYYNPELALRALTLAKEKLPIDQMSADQSWQFHSALGLMQLTTGRREDSIPTWQKCIELASQTSSPAGLGMNAHYNLACAYSLLSRLDDAFASLKKAFEMEPPEGVAQLKTHGEQDPDLENMRADDRWKELVGE